MITMKEIRTALAGVIRGLFPKWELYLNNNPDAKADYIVLELAEDRETVDPVYYDRRIDVDIHVIPLPDVRGNVDRRTLYDAQDKLEHAFLPVFKLGDRHITIHGTSSRIVDAVLHFSFTLSFTDYEPEEPQELMNVLYINGATDTEEE